MSEIDDIFASKGKGKLKSAVVEETPKSNDPSRKKKKKKKSKDAQPESKLDAKSSPSTSSKKRPAPETVVDPSQKIEATSKRHKPNPLPAQKEGKAKKSKVKDDEEKFKDSRGTSGRRQTEEGWSVYKEDELGISHEGGDTPLCPFDCECCF